jgi:hypothetical protein
MLFSKTKLIALLCSLCFVAAFAHQTLSQPSATDGRGSLPDSLHASTDSEPNRSQLQERNDEGEPDERVLASLGRNRLPARLREVYDKRLKAEDAHRATAQRERPCRECPTTGRRWFVNKSESRRGLQITIFGGTTGSLYKWLVMSTHKLGQVMNSYCRTISITRNCIRFFYNGRELHDNDTPDSVSEFSRNLLSWTCFLQGFHYVGSRDTGLISPLL